MFKIFARCTGYHPFTPPDHSLYPKCRLIMNYVNRFPCPLLSRWVQPIGSTSKRSEKEQRVRERVEEIHSPGLVAAGLC